MEPERIYTSTLATVKYVEIQKPEILRLVTSEHGVVDALRRADCLITDVSPDFVVLGDSISYDYQQIVVGAELIAQGAGFLAANPEMKCPTERGLRPSCSAVGAPIEKVTGRRSVKRLQN